MPLASTLVGRMDLSEHRYQDLRGKCAGSCRLFVPWGVHCTETVLTMCQCGHALVTGIPVVADALGETQLSPSSGDTPAGKILFLSPLFRPGPGQVLTHTWSLRTDVTSVLTPSSPCLLPSPCLGLQPECHETTPYPLPAGWHVGQGCRADRLFPASVTDDALAWVG